MSAGLIAAAGVAGTACALLATGVERSVWRRLAAGAEREAALVFLAAKTLVLGMADRVDRASRAPAATLGDVSEMVDVVRLGLTAGLSFDAALQVFCSNRDNALARRMERALMSWQMGAATREEELLRVARDMDLRVLETFAVSVGQALALGAPLAESLAAQSREIRAAHRAEVERQIERAPIKLLVPTGTLILPALLLSILGPLLGAGGMM